MTKIEMKSKGAASYSSVMKHLRLISVAVVLLAVCLAFVGGVGADDVWDGTSDTTWYSSSGTTYSVSTAEQLAGLAKLVNDGTDDFAHKTITLTDNIDLNGYEWVPIGTSGKGFHGTFDGASFVISNMTITSTNSNVGLFGDIAWTMSSSITLENIQLKNPSVSGQYNTGALIGQGMTGEGQKITIKNCHVYGTVRINGVSNVGGLVGYTCTSGGLTIQDSSVVGTDESYIEANNGYAGGLIGQEYMTIIIKDSYTSISVTGSEYAGSFVGAFADFGDGGHFEISNAYSASTLTGNELGLVGAVLYERGDESKYKISNSFILSETSHNPIGYITDTSSNEVSADGKVTLSNIKIWPTDVSSSDVWMNKTTFQNLGWDFTDVWTISTNVNDGGWALPYLKSFKPDSNHRERILHLAPKVTVTFDTKEGSEILPSEIPQGVPVTAPSEPVKVGYIFAGWYSDEDCRDRYDFTTPVTADIILYVKWTINQYTITFNTDGGSEISAITQDYDTDVTAPSDPTKDGYIFKGWDKEIPATMPAEDMTITALWEMIPVSSPSGGSESSSGNYLSYPRFTENGGVVDFGSSKVVKAVLLPEGSRGSVLLKVDTIEKWPKELETEYTFDISVEKLGEGISYILFEIPLSTLENLGITSADVCAYHFVDGEWVLLKTTYEVKGDTVCYEAETDSFSPFKLVFEEGAATPKEEETEPVIPPTEEPEDKPQEELPPIDPPVNPTEPESPSPILAVLAGLGTAAVLRRK